MPRESHPQGHVVRNYGARVIFLNSEEHPIFYCTHFRQSIYPHSLISTRQIIPCPKSRERPGELGWHAAAWRGKPHAATPRLASFWVARKTQTLKTNEMKKLVFVFCVSFLHPNVSGSVCLREEMCFKQRPSKHELRAVFTRCSWTRPTTINTMICQAGNNQPLSFNVRRKSWNWISWQMCLLDASTLWDVPIREYVWDECGKTWEVARRQDPGGKRRGGRWLSLLGGTCGSTCHVHDVRLWSSQPPSAPQARQSPPPVRRSSLLWSSMKIYRVAL